MRWMLVMAAVLAPGGVQAQDWTWSGRLGAVSDYRDRGYTLSEGNAVLQGELTLSHASGV